MAESKTSPRRIAAADKRRQALKLKLAGATYEQIAKTPTDPANGDLRPLYSSRQRAHEAVTTALKEIRSETRGDAEELRTLELARLESMQVALWPGTRPTKAVTQECHGCGAQVVMYREVDKEAVDRVIRIMERRSRYLGLDSSGKADRDGDGDDGRSMLAKVAAGLQAVYDEIAAEDAAHGHDTVSPADTDTDV